MVTDRRVAAAVGCLLVVALQACSSDSEPPAPGPLGAEDVDGSALGQVRLTPLLPCDPESGTVWTDADADDFRAFSRTQDGHRETVVVGVWEVAEADAERQWRAFDRRLHSAECRQDGYQVTGGADQVTVTQTRAEPMVVETRGYDHAAGYMVAAWIRRSDGTSPSTAELVLLRERQMEELPGR